MRLLHYLKHTIHFGLYLRRRRPLLLQVYSNVDWVGDRDDYTYTIAFILFLGGNPISWCSKKQRIVARSSTEAEYRVVASTTTKATWVSNLFFELGVTLPQSPTIFYDNLNATHLCVNLIFHSCMKHVALDYHFVREKVVASFLKVSHIPTLSQLADVLTKPLFKI